MDTTFQIVETPIFQRIYEIRGQKVMLDFDLAELYQVEKRVLNQSVKRNINRFPLDFMFQLTRKETFTTLKSQIVISKQQLSENEENRGGSRHLPYAFTELGIAMLSTVLRSEKAIEVNIAIMRAFVALRQYALNYADLSNRLEEHIKTSDNSFSEVFEILEELTAQKKLYENRQPIGFVVRENN